MCVLISGICPPPASLRCSRAFSLSFAVVILFLHCRFQPFLVEVPSSSLEPCSTVLLKVPKRHTVTFLTLCSQIETRTGRYVSRFTSHAGCVSLPPKLLRFLPLPLLIPSTNAISPTGLFFLFCPSSPVSHSLLPFPVLVLACLSSISLVLHHY